MARPTRDEIETYMSITGVTESVARQKLEECGSNLNEAVNAHFGGADIPIAHPPPASIPQHNFTDNNTENQFGLGLFPILSTARSFRPSLLLNPNYRRDLFNYIGTAGFTGRASLNSPPGAVMGLPVNSSSRHERLHHPALRPNLGNDHMATEYNASHLSNDVEDEMIQAAIMASKREAEDSCGSERTLQEDDDFARAVSLSLKLGSSLNSNGTQNAEEEQQLRQKAIHRAGVHPQNSEVPIHFEEWGGISTKELDEALMLETALFGKISEGASSNSLNATQLQSGLEKRTVPALQPVRHPPSQSLPASQSLGEQQDMEYLTSLLLNKEKKEESHKKMLNEVECERRLAARKASVLCEPTSDDENAVTLLVRMPNGSRLGRRFLKSDKLQLLFDFIDISGAVKPGTYRVVRSYPRRAFTDDDGLLTLSKLDLTNKQEALFLELI